MRSPTVRLASREELLGYIPYGLGFHPAESLVLLGLGPRHVEMCARADASWPTREHLRQFSQALRRLAAIQRVFLIGYGPPDIAGPVRTVADGLACRGFTVMEMLRVQGNRFWCLRCDTCTPPQGLIFDVSSSAAAATATYAGMVARADRGAVEKLVRPIGGLASIAMAQAVDRAERRLDTLAGHLRDAGRAAVDEAMAMAEAGQRLDDDAVAWLSLLLHDSDVRDHAWRHTDRHTWQLQLWLDLTRRAEPSLVAPIAALLGWCAWRQGDGALSMVAVTRALRVDRGCLLARFVQDQLDQARPPKAVKSWPLPLG